MPNSFSCFRTHWHQTDKTELSLRFSIQRMAGIRFFLPFHVVYLLRVVLYDADNFFIVLEHWLKCTYLKKTYFYIARIGSRVTTNDRNTKSYKRIDENHQSDNRKTEKVRGTGKKMDGLFITANLIAYGPFRL